MIKLDSQRLKGLSALRRQIHAHPELSFEEKETTNLVCHTLNGAGIKTQRLPGSPGAVALVQGRSPGPCLGLRADMDALPIQEENNVAYASVYPKKMHACGHDANTTIMLGVAQTLVKTNPGHDFKGSAKFIFQPAEEREYGAKSLIEQGVLENPRVDRVIAGHMAPDLDTGTIGIFEEKGYAAADLFSMTIEGRGGHGGRPHETRDALSAGAYFITALQTLVSRNMDPVDPAVISVGKFRSGDVGNVIPETAVMEGTIRTHSLPARDMIIRRLNELSAGIETGFDVRCRIEIFPETPGCTNDPQVSRFLYDIAADLLGKDRVRWLPPTMGAEDFAYFTRERPGAIVRLGCRNKARGITAPLHSPYFDIDEEVLDIGVQFFYRALSKYLG